jgi:photosystem II stability/assembly factor-like uncharacterized protein
MKKHAVWSFAITSVALISLLAAQPGYGASYDLGSLQYRGIGPAISGGRTTVVVGSDLDPLLYFAGGAGGGIFKSTDGGFTWLPVFDKADVAPIGAIALGPHDPRDVWVGTGESNPRNDVEGGDGVWHSTDGGKTWMHAGLEDAGSISNISIDPRDARRVVVGVLGQVFRDSTMRGVYTTTDAGAHWTRALFVGPSTGASDLVRVPDHPDTLFAGMYEFRRKPWTMTSGGPNGGLYRSDDGGNTWRKLTGNGLPAGDTGRIGLSIGSGGRVYAIIQSKAGDLWRSDDGGATWRVMPRNWLVGGRRFYFSRIFMDPADSNRLIDVGLILSISTDGGRTFNKTATNAGWDYHQVWWSQDGRRVAVATDEGVVLSADSAATWHQPYDLPFSQPYHIGFDDAQPNYHVCIGLQDNDSWCGSYNGDSGLGVLNRDWWTVAPGDGMWTVYDPLDSNLIWSTSTNSGTGQTYLWDSRTQQASDVSPDAELSGLVPARALGHRFNWDTPIAFTSDGKALVGGNALYESADHGRSWTIISPDLTRDDRAHQAVPGGPIDADMSGAEAADTILYIASSGLESGLLWVGTDDGLVQITRDGGRTWSNVTPKGAPTYGRVAGIEPGRFAAGTAFIAVDDHMLGDDRPYLYMTRDYGSTWTSISGDLPKDVFARSVRQDPVNPSLLFAGTQRGMWASWDLGAHWQSLRLNMPASAIYDIEIQPRADDLLVASHGRGVWVLDDIRPLEQLASAGGSLTLFAPRDAYRWFRWSPVNPFPDGLPTNDFTGPNVPYGALITYDLGKGKHKAASIQVFDSSGRVVRHLTGKAVPHEDGLNRAAWDLDEDGPVKWSATYETNQGPATGAEVMPGTYTVALNVDGVVRKQRVVVKLDPRDPATLEQAQLRHDTLAELNREFGALDTMLNTIDKKLKSAPPSARSALLAFRRRLTSDPRNDEDLSGPPGLRDRIGDLIYRLTASSYQAPTQPQLAVAASLKQAFAAIDVDYKSLR